MIEFNIALKPTKLVRGQGFAKLLAKKNCRSLDIDFLCTMTENRQTNIEEQAARTRGKQLVAESLASCH